MLKPTKGAALSQAQAQPAQVLVTGLLQGEDQARRRDGEGRTSPAPAHVDAGRIARSGSQAEARLRESCGQGDVVPMGINAEAKRGRQGLGGKNLAALTTEGISLVVADPAIFCDRRKKMAPRLSPAGPKVGLDEACAPDRGCRVGSLRCRADKPNASPRSRPRPVPLARKFDRGVQGVSEVASAHSRPEQRVNNVNFVIEVDGVGYFGGDDPHSARSRSPAAARVARSRRATIREAEKIAHDRLHDFRIRFALERLSRVAVFELGPRASWPSWRTNRSRSASTVSSAVSVLSSAAVTPVSS